jgi:hypothetical protein
MEDSPGPQTQQTHLRDSLTGTSRSAEEARGLLAWLEAKTARVQLIRGLEVRVSPSATQWCDQRTGTPVPKDIESFSQGQRPVARQDLGSVARRKRLITCFASELPPSATQWCGERLEALMLRTQQYRGQCYLGRPRSGATNYQRQKPRSPFYLYSRSKLRTFLCRVSR